MLKRQKPQDPSQYIAVNPTKISQYHRDGFYPEYLWGSQVYFRVTPELTSYIANGEKKTPVATPKATIKQTVKKEDKVKPSSKETKDSKSK